MIRGKYNIAIVGLGWWGKQLFNYFDAHKFCTISAVCDASGKQPANLDLKGAHFYSNAKEMFDQEKLDGVVVATPPAHHLEVIREAAKHHVPVFCEKPMAATVADCDEIVRVCEENNTMLFVAFKHRYARAFRYLKEQEKKLGKPMFVMYTAPLFHVSDPGWKFKPGECDGILIENAVHYIDNLRYLCGEFDTIYSEGDNFAFKNVSVVDTAITTIRFKNGAIGGLGNGATSHPNITAEIMDIHYENAVARVWGSLDAPFNMKICYRVDGFVEEYHYEGSYGVEEEVLHFFECIENGELPLANGRDGREAVYLAHKIMESAVKREKLQV